MTRSEYLSLTNLTAEGFKSLFRRGQVPLLAVELIVDKDDETIRYGYLPLEAIMMVLTNEMSCDGGFDRLTASQLVVGYNNLTIEALSCEDTATANSIWIVFAKEAGILGVVIGEVGTAAEIASKLPPYAENESGEPLRFSSLIWLSLTVAIQIVRERAKACGISLPEKLVA